jgi:hypothetical protein
MSALREISLALEGKYGYYYMGARVQTLSTCGGSSVIRLLHPFLYKDALQRPIFSKLSAG